MIELHCHILPGIDDGARTTAEAVSLLELLKKQGVSAVVLTPHFYPDRQQLASFLDRRSKALETLMSAAGDGLGLKLLPASETMISEALFAYESLDALLIPGTGHLLLELPYGEWGGSIFRSIDKLMARYAFTPIIAHPERYEGYQKKPEKNLDELLELGCLLQMNIDSLIDRRTRRYAEKLSKKGYIDYIGSDCHNLTSRPPRYPEFHEVIEQNRLQDAYKRWMTASQKLLPGL